MWTVLAIGVWAGLFWLERRRPARSRVETVLRHTARNLTVAGLGAIALQFAETPVIRPLTALVVRKHWGLLQQASLPVWIEVAISVLLLDYTLYIWHVLTHRVNALWRFHAVHHADLDLDASTALRFHFGELVISVAWRSAQVLVIGVSPLSFAIWQTMLFPSILFHHSNIRLSSRVERMLSRFVVTPGMHAIHHSIVGGEMNSNWSSGLSIWDKLHGTLRRRVPHEITIGLADRQSPAQITLRRILLMPSRGRAD